MEDVVLHIRPGSAAGLRSLLETTQKLLEPFPCRTPQVFTAWFPSATDVHLPIRPVRPAPIITCSGDSFFFDRRPSVSTNTPEKGTDDPFAEGPHERVTAKKSSVDLKQPEDGTCISETPDHLLPALLSNKTDREISRLSPKEQKDKTGCTVTDSPRKRSWSVFTQRGILLQSSQSMSKQFHHTVIEHKLHLRQRAKWVINHNNCGQPGTSKRSETVEKAVGHGKVCVTSCFVRACLRFGRH